MVALWLVVTGMTGPFVATVSIPTIPIELHRQHVLTHGECKGCGVGAVGP